MIVISDQSSPKSLAQRTENEDGPFEGEELSSLQFLVNSLNPSFLAQEFVVKTTLKLAYM